MRSRSRQLILFSLGLMSPWSLLNFLLLGLAAWVGYSEMAPDRLTHSNPDIIFCGIVLLGMVAFSLGTVWYAVSGAHQATLRRPSWRRFSLDWWRDPLQCLFLCSCFAGAMAVGAAVRLPGTTGTGFWMFMFFVCLFTGLVLGQFAVYALHRERIAKT